MSRFPVLTCALVMAGTVSAGWLWPFGDDDDDEKRLSELMEPASLLIDDAADFAADGKVHEAVEKYRAALVELDKVEMENPERAASVEFATLRNKRAYVNAAIDSMLMSQAKDNAKTVAVSDTTELEKRLAEEEGKKSKSAPSGTNGVAKAAAKSKPTAAKASAEKKSAKASAKPLGRREQVMQDIANKEFEAADIGIQEWLRENPNNVIALNLKAAMEAERGNAKAAERALDQAIGSNPRSHFAYYNMAQLLLDGDPSSKAVARRYYETGRTVGGPVDAKLEARLK